MLKNGKSVPVLQMADRVWLMVQGLRERLQQKGASGSLSLEVMKNILK